jgi:hypothetical protein
MGEISNPERATYFVAYGPNGTVHTGVTEPGQVTTTGQPSLESTTEENEYIGILNTVATQFPSLPAAGTPLKAGEIYSWNGGAVMVRQDHIELSTTQPRCRRYLSCIGLMMGLIGLLASKSMSGLEERITLHSMKQSRLMSRSLIGRHPRFQRFGK